MKDLVLKGQRVAIIATDGVEKVELTLPRLALEEAGADTMLIAPKPEIQSMKHDQRDERFQADMTLADAHPDEFDAVLLPGGALNADKLRMETAAREFVQHIDQSGKPIADIRRRAVPASQRWRRAVLRFCVPDGDHADRGVLVRDAERCAQLRLIEHTEEDRAQARVDSGEENEQRGHPGVDVPVRHRPMALAHVGPALV